MMRELCRTLSRKEMTYIDDFMGAEITRDGGMGGGKYSKLGKNSARRVMSSIWASIFNKAPRLSSETMMYRAISNEHGKVVCSMRKGAVINIMEHSSYAHSPNMVRRYAEFLDNESNVCIMCVHVPANTKFVFLSGLKSGVPVDDTQGEIILQPCVLKRIGGRVIKVKMLKRRSPRDVFKVCLTEMQYVQ
jgi:hypothetical protein